MHRTLIDRRALWALVLIVLAGCEKLQQMRDEKDGKAAAPAATNDSAASDPTQSTVAAAEPTAPPPAPRLHSRSSMSSWLSLLRRRTTRI